MKNFKRELHKQQEEWVSHDIVVRGGTNFSFYNPFIALRNSTVGSGIKNIVNYRIRKIFFNYFFSRKWDKEETTGHLPFPLADTSSLLSIP